MKRRIFRTSIVAGLCTAVLLGLAGPAGAYSNDFETDTAGWNPFAGSTITQQQDNYDNPGDYGDLISSAGGTNHARLGRGDCVQEDAHAGGGPTARCYGPYTFWGNDGQGNVWNGAYTTQVDIYLDTAYANANPDTYGGNYTGLTAPGGSSDPTVKGTRFDFTSAINSSAPLVNGQATHLRDFGFNVSTGYVDDGCDGFMITGQTVVNRINANPNIGGHNPQCIDQGGWYTFKHSFTEEGGFLKVVMDVIPAGQTQPAATWTITGIDPISTVGCNRYGWFSNQEIFGLPIDNASMTGGCDATPEVGKITPTGTTCQQYRDTETAPVPELDQLQYTTKGTKINAVTPGVFFYYTKVSGNKDQVVSITEENNGTPTPYPNIPINQGQVVLYDAITCKVMKWTVTLVGTGEATGTLPKTGDFIIGVKYNPSALKGAAVPASPPVTYTFGGELGSVAFDEVTIDLVPKA